MTNEETQKKPKSGARVALIGSVGALAIGAAAYGARNANQAEQAASEVSIAGHYEIVSMEGNNVPSEEDLAFLQQSGLTITMDIQENGTGVMHLFGEEMDFSYDLESHTFEIDDQQFPFTTDEETLTLQQDSGNMIFKPVE